MEITYQTITLIISILSLYGVMEWRLQGRFKDVISRCEGNLTSVWNRIDTIKAEYVRKDVHSLIVEKHDDDIKEIKSDLHEMKATVESISKNVSILINRHKEE